MARQFFLLSEQAVEAIEKTLATLVADSQGSYALVIDRSGYLIASHGQTTHVHPEELAAIAAGIVSAMQVVVNLAESKESTIHFYSDSMSNFHFVWINPRVFLLLAFDNNTPEAALRSKAGLTAMMITPYLAQDQTQQVDIGSGRFIEDKFSELFQDL